MGAAHRSFFLIACLLFGLHASADTVLEQDRGSCPNGAYPDSTWPEGRPGGIAVWGSCCAQGDRNVGLAASAPFQATTVLDLDLAGYPGYPGISLHLENLAEHLVLSITPNDLPSTRWLKYRFVLPPSWEGQSVRLIAKDFSTGLGGWIGFSQSLLASQVWALGEPGELVLRTAAHYLLLCISCFAFCSYAIVKGVRDSCVLGLIALMGIASPGYVVFWLCLLSPRAGHAVSFFLPLLAAGASIVLVKRIGRPGLVVLKPLLIPAALVFVSALWILAAGFAYGGVRAPFATAAIRFSHQLPPDNRIPYLFAEGVRLGHVPSPLLGDWLSSDRPPLDTAIALSQYPFSPQPRALSNECISVVLQESWILALWILLTAFEIDRRAITAILATAMFWGFTLVNGFFVWPKLLAAAYLISVCAILFTDRFAAALRKSVLIPVVLGASLAFAFLAHGGSVFGSIGVALTLLITRRRIPVRALLIAGVAAVILYSPWIAYQKLYDPPGNRLLKMHLAGMSELDRNSLTQDLRSAYSHLRFSKWLKGREYNVDVSMDHLQEYWGHVGTLVASLAAGDLDNTFRAAKELRWATFFYFAPSLGFIELGLPALAAGFWNRFRTKTWRVALRLWIFVISSLVIWCLIMYSPGSTSIHQGCYAVNLLAMTAGVLGLWAVSPWLAYIACSLQVVQAMLIYGVFMRMSPVDDMLLEGTVQYGIVCLFLVSFCITWALLMRLATRPVRVAKAI